MRMYLLSPGAGLLVGAIYSLLSVRSPAPPLVGLLGILAGEPVIPVGKQLLTGTSLAAAWRYAKCVPHLFGELPGRHNTPPAEIAQPTPSREVPS